MPTKETTPKETKSPARKGRVQKSIVNPMTGKYLKFILECVDHPKSHVSYFNHAPGVVFCIDIYRSTSPLLREIRASLQEIFNESSRGLKPMLPLSWSTQLSRPKIMTPQRLVAPGISPAKIEKWLLLRILSDATLNTPASRKRIWGGSTFGLFGDWALRRKISRKESHDEDREEIGGWTWNTNIQCVYYLP